MIRSQRLLIYAGAILFTLTLCVTFFPGMREQSSLVDDQPLSEIPIVKDERLNQIPEHDPSIERYMSWFPFGDFPEQLEALQTGLRLALDNKRTLIIPKVRLGSSYDWIPFPELAKRFEAQDKDILRQLCSSGNRHWRTEVEPCATINDWTEVSWKMFFDIDALAKTYKIKIIEREGHGWGVDDTDIKEKIRPDDVQILDAQTYLENGTNWKIEEMVRQSNGDVSSHQYTTVHESLPTSPLMGVVDLKTMKQLQPVKYLQFGSLSFARRYEYERSGRQVALQKAMRKSVMMVPTMLESLTAEAGKIIKTLGGAKRYSSATIHLGKFVESDLKRPILSSALADQSTEYMADVVSGVVRELFSGIPVSLVSSIPLRESNLRTFLETHPVSSLTSSQRHDLLNVCIEYQRTVEKRYPIYYIANDAADAYFTQPDVFGSLMEFLPCGFSKSDMVQWGVLDWSWTKSLVQFNDPGVDYASALGPILDILVDSKSFSFIETPQTRLSNIMSWQPRMVTM